MRRSWFRSPGFTVTRFNLPSAANRPFSTWLAERLLRQGAGMGVAFQRYFGPVSP
jgi:hypothetical protein